MNGTIKEHVIGVIPARMTSARLPGKPLAMIAGKSMIQRVVQRVVKASLLDSVIVAHDDQRIADEINSLNIRGVEAVMTRSDHPSGTDRIAEAISGKECDVVINIQGDEPLIDPAIIDGLGRAMLEDAIWDMATAATPIKTNEDLNDTSVVKAVFGANGYALYFSRLPIPYVRDLNTAVKESHFRHLGIYAYRKDYLLKLVKEPPCMLEKLEKLEQLRALHIGCNMKVLKVDDVGIGVDTPEDIAKVEAILKELGDD